MLRRRVLMAGTCLVLAVAGLTIFVECGTTYVRQPDPPFASAGPNDNMALDLVLTGWGHVGLLTTGFSLLALTLLISWWTVRAYATPTDSTKAERRG